VWLEKASAQQVSCLQAFLKPAYTDNKKAETLTISKRTAAKRTVSTPTPIPYRFLPPAKNSYTLLATPYKYVIEGIHDT